MVKTHRRRHDLNFMVSRHTGRDVESQAGAVSMLAGGVTLSHCQTAGRETTGATDGAPAGERQQRETHTVLSQPPGYSNESSLTHEQITPASQKGRRENQNKMIMIAGPRPLPQSLVVRVVKVVKVVREVRGVKVVRGVRGYNQSNKKSQSSQRSQRSQRRQSE